MLTKTLAVALLFSLVGLTGCKAGAGGECFKNSQCETELVCYEKKCASLDDANAACTKLPECQGKQCYFDPEGPEIWGACKEFTPPQ